MIISNIAKMFSDLSILEEEKEETIKKQTKNKQTNKQKHINFTLQPRRENRVSS